MNSLLLTDSYKVTHWLQYPPKTTEVYSYLSARVNGGHTTQFGLQGILSQFAGPFCTHDQINEAEKIMAAHFSGAALFNTAGWRLLLERHHGYLPVEIKAVPEGTTVDNRNVLMTIRNTDPDFFWLPNWLETLLVQVWYPTTVCTYSRDIKNIIADALYTSEGNIDGLTSKLHDFGFRGVSSVESAAIGGGAHLVNFVGTDNLVALLWLSYFYKGGAAEGFSIPAAEHGTIVPWGRDGEGDAFANMLDQFSTGYVAVVSDTYDIDYACKVLWGSELKDRVLKRAGTLVIRPDSGPPAETVLRVLTTLGHAFGLTKNGRGYARLPAQVRLIQGDGVDKETVSEVLDTLMNAGYSADNVAFGSGGALLQRHDRDEQGFALKVSSVTVGGLERGVFKSPIGDPGKASKPGKLALQRLSSGIWQTVAADSRPGREENQLRTVFLNGQLVNSTPIAEVRRRAMVELEKPTAEVETATAESVTQVSPMA